VMWYPIEQSLVFSSMFNLIKNLVTLFYPPASFFFSLLLLLCLLLCITSHKTCAGAKLRVFFSSKWQICIFNILKRPRIDSFLSRSWLKLQVDLIIEWLCCWDVHALVSSLLCLKLLKVDRSLVVALGRVKSFESRFLNPFPLQE